MRLSCQTYSKIMEFIKTFSRLDSKSFDDLFKSFPEVERNTLSSILHYHIKNKTIMNSRRVKNEINEIIDLYREMVKEGKSGIFIYLAEKYEVSPIFIARQVVDHLESKDFKERDLTCKDVIWDSTLINNGALAYEVHIASLFDSTYSQIANIISSLSGKEYEIYLQSCLCSQGLSFKTENDLRNLNFNKTPDILLDIPFALDGCIIKWIESKACFGNEALHKDYLNQQYQHYLRFGPGLVIYWHGFLESIKCVSKKLLIYDHFPKKIVKINA